ncbi:MAG TPA: indole-3-glycerol phosphate synthase TrpC [Rhodospirillaceae bacterium]|jgi:indole-3-glycerol phosphate synthase|nr:indole-3-glycerol phosphate synthase TrpC [Alphaproteobacteria bacterium]HBH25882.1 indole-3-glycerol phosphate synthase TrpC [Rhodospirillaceae bacterium]
MGVLGAICEAKRAHVAACRARVPLAEIRQRAESAGPARGFAAALAARPGPALIAEVKRASPSKGTLFPQADAAEVAQAYERGGAACLSVLTDTPYFGGRDEDLVQARAATRLPVLRKDFTLEPYQVYEARALGADAILLILAALEDPLAASLASLAADLGMDVLCEVHNEAELARAAALGARLIGVNARNLGTLAVDLAVPRALIARMPQGALPVAESGIDGPETLTDLHAQGYRAFLVGEALMRAPDQEIATRALLRGQFGEDAKLL